MNKKFVGKILFLKGAFVSKDNGKSWQPCEYVNKMYFFTSHDRNMKELVLKGQVPKEFMGATFIKQEPRGKIMSILASIRKVVNKAKN